MSCVFPLEDWIALVKAAAAAAAKNKTGSKPRTSANSNKDKEKEERKWFKVPSKKEETAASISTPEVEKKEDLLTSSDAFGTKCSYVHSYGSGKLTVNNEQVQTLGYL